MSDATDATDAAAETKAALTGPKIRAAGIILLVVAVASFMTALFMNNQDGKALSGALPPLGGTLGPYEFAADQVLDVEVRQALKQEGWSFVDVELLDED